VDAWAALAEERGLGLRSGSSSTPVVRAGRDRVEQVLDNLLSNAFEAVGPGGEVEVSTAATGAYGELRVRDDGPGLQPGARPGVGISNTRARLEHLYGDAQSLALDNDPAGGVRVTVVAPYRPAP